jgi:mono/diheme cytochrome c family protein
MRARHFAILSFLFLLSACLLWAREGQKPGQAPLPGEPSAPTIGQVPAVPHSYNVTAQEKERKNPIRFTEVSTERGKKVFLTQCAMCHGIKGDGKGDLAEEMKIAPTDFTKPDALKKRTDGELFKIIGIGNNIMPSQEARMPEKQRWNIINYLRALGGAAPEKATGKEPEENIIEVPQDQHR